MNEDAILRQWAVWRHWVVELLEATPEEIVDDIPEANRNSIRWNAGHLLVGFDHQIASVLGVPRQLPVKYHVMFPRESSPADWQEDPPSMTELIGHLKRQPQELGEKAKGKLDTPLNGDFLGIQTLGEMLQFLTAHDALHLSIIKTMRQKLLASH